MGSTGSPSICPPHGRAIRRDYRFLIQVCDISSAPCCSPCPGPVRKSVSLRRRDDWSAWVLQVASNGVAGGLALHVFLASFVPRHRITSLRCTCTSDAHRPRRTPRVHLDPPSGRSATALDTPRLPHLLQGLGSPWSLTRSTRRTWRSWPVTRGLRFCGWETAQPLLPLQGEESNCAENPETAPIRQRHRHRLDPDLRKHSADIGRRWDTGPHLDSEAEPWRATFPGLSTVLVDETCALTIEPDRQDDDIEDAPRWGWGNPVSLAGRPVGGPPSACATRCVPPPSPQGRVGGPGESARIPTQWRSRCPATTSQPRLPV